MYYNFSVKMNLVNGDISVDDNDTGENYSSKWSGIIGVSIAEAKEAFLWSWAESIHVGDKIEFVFITEEGEVNG